MQRQIALILAILVLIIGTCLAFKAPLLVILQLSEYSPDYTFAEVSIAEQRVLNKIKIHVGTNHVIAGFLQQQQIILYSQSQITFVDAETYQVIKQTQFPKFLQEHVLSMSYNEQWDKYFIMGPNEQHGWQIPTLYDVNIDTGMVERVACTWPKTWIDVGASAMDAQNNMFYYPAPVRFGSSSERHTELFSCNVLTGVTNNVTLVGDYFAPSYMVKGQVIRRFSEHAVSQVNTVTGAERILFNSTAGFRRTNADSQFLYNFALGSTLEVFNLTSNKLQNSFSMDLQQGLFVTGALILNK